MARVLIVDDSRYMRHSLSSILSEAGHEIVGEAENGFEAFEKYIQLMPQVVTMDITMPDENGLNALKKIRLFDRKARVIMVTAIGNREKVLEALNNGAENYIIKPFEKNKVLDAIGGRTA